MRWFLPRQKWLHEEDVFQHVTVAQHLPLVPMAALSILAGSARGLRGMLLMAVFWSVFSPVWFLYWHCFPLRRCRLRIGADTLHLSASAGGRVLTSSHERRAIAEVVETTETVREVPRPAVEIVFRNGRRLRLLVADPRRIRELLVPPSLPRLPPPHA